jgi:hypothetical protein
MAKKLKPGQKRCPSCGTAVSGPRAKACPKCGHEFNGKPQKAPTAKAAPAKPTKNGGDKPEVNKAQAVRDYFAANPTAGPTAVVAALKKQGVDVAPNYVAAIKGRLSKTGTAKKLPAAAVVVPVAVEKPVTNGGTITLEQVKQVAQTVKAMGGFQRMTEVLDVIKASGGVKKFKDLAEAITATSTDDIPF